MFDFITFGITDFIDILLFAIILYNLYRLLRGTAAIRIFWTIAILYVLWKVFSAMHFKLVSGVVGQILSVGIVALLSVFQPEIRKFLLMIGNARVLRVFRHNKKTDTLFLPEINAVVRACRRMSDSKTGALIVFEKETPLDECIATGEKLDAIVSRELIENIFFKNSAPPLRHRRHRAERCSGRGGLRADRQHLAVPRRRHHPWYLARGARNHAERYFCQ